MAEANAASTATLGYVSASGDSFSIGRALGAAAAGALREVVPRIGRFRALAENGDARRVAAALEVAGRAAYPEYMREIDGMAAGAGLPFDDVWLWNCRGDIPGGGDQSGAALAGCTTVMLASRDGSLAIIGHNEDDQPELNGQCFMVRVEPEDGAAFTSFYSPGLLPGHTFAVSDYGLVQTINHIRPRDQRIGVARHLIARAILAQRSLDDAVAILKRTDRASGFHHNLGMRGDHRLLSVEAPASGCSVEVADDSPRAHTNHLTHSRFRAIDQEIAASSRDRLARANSLFSAGAMAAGNPLTLLTDRGNGGLPIYRKGNRPDDPGYTLATAIFEIDRDRIDWRVYSDADGVPAFERRLAFSDIGRP